MADATFDGINLLILLPAGQATVDVQAEMYSAWKEFLLADKTNLRFPQAFTTEGGSDTVPGEVSGRNFFVRNDLGWRVRPAEEDAEIVLAGNLFATDTSLPMVIPTLGAFTVLTTIQRSSLALVETTGVNQVDLELVRQAVAGHAEISADNLTVTIFAVNGSVLRVLDISSDGRIRTVAP